MSNKYVNEENIGKKWGKGKAHWLAQRVTAIVLIPTILWFLYSLFSVIYLDYQSATVFFSSGFNVIMATLFIGFSIHHFTLGLGEILIDYVSYEKSKKIHKKLTLICRAIGLLAILSILNIYF